MRNRLMTLGTIAALLFAPAGWAAEEEGPAAPQTFLEMYERAFECMFYFGRIHEELEESGAAAEEAARYEDMGFNFIWALTGFDSVLSQRELESVTEAEINQRLDAYADLDALQGVYDAMCVDLHDNWKAHYDGIVRRLEEQSGELYLDLKGECVTVSTDLLSVTGEYMGMSGPSVKKVPRGGLKIPDPTGEDNFKVALPRGSLADWYAIPIPPPPKAHEELLDMTPDEQAQALAQPVIEMGRGCTAPHKAFFRGLSGRGHAYWAVTCEEGSAYGLRIDESNEIEFDYNCAEADDRYNPECYVPCERESCWTPRPGVTATVEYVPYTAATRVQPAPDELCADMSGGLTTQFRDTLPKLRRGKAHKPAMAIADAPACSALSSPLKLVLEVYATQRLNMLKLDVATLEVTSLTLDHSAGPPCALVHADPLDSDYADLRCRLTGDPDALMAGGPNLAVRGRFNNGDPFEGMVEACSGE